MERPLPEAEDGAGSSHPCLGGPGPCPDAIFQVSGDGSVSLQGCVRKGRDGDKQGPLTRGVHSRTGREGAWTPRRTPQAQLQPLVFYWQLFRGPGGKKSKAARVTPGDLHPGIQGQRRGGCSSALALLRSHFTSRPEPPAPCPARLPRTCRLPAGDPRRLASEVPLPLGWSEHTFSNSGLLATGISECLWYTSTMYQHPRGCQTTKSHINPAR